MFEKYYSDVLEYIFHHPSRHIIKIESELHLSRAIIGATIQELLIDKLIINDEINGVIKNGFIITDKGLAYLEDKQLISLTKEVKNQKLLLSDLNEKAKPNNITTIHKYPIIRRVKNISLIEWGVIWTIIAAVITLWVYVINPIMNNLFR